MGDVNFNLFKTVTEVQNETVKPIINSNNSNKYDLWTAFDLQVEECQNTREVADATIFGPRYSQKLACFDDSKRMQV